MSSIKEKTLFFVKSYAGLLGEETVDCDSLPIEKGFYECKKILDSRFNLPRACFDLGECRLEHNSIKIEGLLRDCQTTLYFDSRYDFDIPEIQPGNEVRIRYEGGSFRAVVLQCDNNRILLAKAPNRLERRVHTRVPVHGIAIVNLESQKYDSSIVDISEGGVGLTSAVPVELGQNVHILMRIEGKKNLPLEVDGVIASCKKISQEGNSCRIGIRFLRASEQVLQEIRDTIREVKNS